MRKILAIASKDVSSIFRNVVALAMMLAAPLVLASLLGFAFGGDSGFSVAATKVAFVNLDQGYQSTGAQQPDQETALLGATIEGVLKSPGLEDLIDVTGFTDEAAARAAVDRGEVVVAVIVPADFTRSLMDPTSSRVSAVTLYNNPTQTLGPAIVSGVVRQIVDMFNGSRAAAAAAVAVAGQTGALPGQTGGSESLTPAQLQEKISAAATAYIQQAQSGDASGVEGRDPQVSGPQAKEPGVAGLVLTGMMVFFMFFGGANTARSILDEDFQGTLPRLFTTPTPHSVVLGGKMTSVFLTVLAQGVILLLAGWLIFRIDWGSLGPVVLLTLDTALVSAGLAVFLVSLMKTPAQAGAITSGVFVTLGLLGGNFVGSVPPGGFFATVRRFTPNGWLLEGWDKVMRGAGISDIVLQLVVVLAFALATFIAGALIFRRRYA